MPFGLRVWNSGGGLILDTSDRITGYYGAFGWSIPANEYRTHIYIPGANAATWFAYCDTQYVTADIIDNHVRLTWFLYYHPQADGGTVYVFRG
jgi:hypothetical protein